MTTERRLSPWRVYRQAQPVWSLLFVGMNIVVWLFVIQDIAAWQDPVPDATIALLMTAFIWLQTDLACTREELRLNKIRGAQWPPT